MMQDKQLRPVYYIEREADYLQPWPGPSSISEFLLLQRRRDSPPDARKIHFEGIKLHALFFNDGSCWDVRNGWRANFNWKDRIAHGKEYCQWCNWQIGFDRDSCENCHARTNGKLDWICTCEDHPHWVWHQREHRWECACCDTKVEVPK